MPIIVHQDSAKPAVSTGGLVRQVLLDRARTGSDAVRVERWVLAPGGETPLEAAAGSLVWLQVLGGAGALAGDGEARRVTDAHVLFLPPGFRGALRTESGASLLRAEVPDAARFDPAFAAAPPPLRCVDWTREPVLDSEHDARKRIYLVTPKLFGTKVIKGEMIIYPPGTVASNHHHEGAEHFMYVLRGGGILYSNETPHEVRAGDILFHPERERHYLENNGTEELVFSEFFIPAEYTTVWVDEARVCAWLPTGRNIRGGAPSREIRAHSSASVESPEDV